MDKDDIAEIIERTARALNLNINARAQRAFGLRSAHDQEMSLMLGAIAGELFGLAHEFRKGLTV